MLFKSPHFVPSFSGQWCENNHWPVWWEPGLQSLLLCEYSIYTVDINESLQLINSQEKLFFSFKLRVYACFEEIVWFHQSIWWIFNTTLYDLQKLQVGLYVAKCLFNVTWKGFFLFNPWSLVHNFVTFQVNSFIRVLRTKFSGKALTLDKQQLTFSISCHISLLLTFTGV